MPVWKPFDWRGEPMPVWKPFVWQPRFSLRGLLVFVLLVSLGLGWLGHELRHARRQRRAVEAQRACGRT